MRDAIAACTELDLRNAGITDLTSGDFSDLIGLTNLNLHNNDINSLLDGIFEGLTALTSLQLRNNLVEPMPIVVSLEKMVSEKIKAVDPVGAPFDIYPPLYIKWQHHGSLYSTDHQCRSFSAR